MAKTPSTRDHKTAARHSKASDASRRGARKQTARAKSKTVTTQRAAFLRRAVKLINDAAGQLDGTREAIKKMFGPLTPAERRDLRAGRGTFHVALQGCCFALRIGRRGGDKHRQPKADEEADHLNPSC